MINSCPVLITDFDVLRITPLSGGEYLIVVPGSHQTPAGQPDLELLLEPHIPITLEQMKSQGEFSLHYLTDSKPFKIRGIGS